MQRGLGGFPHSLLHQDGSREQGTGSKNYHNLLLYRFNTSSTIGKITTPQKMRFSEIDATQKLTF